ncbi:hypothetical protein PFISCL1PPCAC_22679, partial [Pristionchus fissidentatus]
LAIEQEVTVTGVLKCGQHNQAGATVKLLEEDFMISIMDRSVTKVDTSGSFVIKYTYNSPYKIVPVLIMEHDCGGDRKTIERLVLLDFWTTESSTVRKRV